MFIPPPGIRGHAAGAEPHPTGGAHSKKESERAREIQQMNAAFQQSISNAYKPQRYNPDAPPQWTASAPHKKNWENQQAMDPFDQAGIRNAEVACDKMYPVTKKDTPIQQMEATFDQSICVSEELSPHGPPPQGQQSKGAPTPHEHHMIIGPHALWLNETK